MSPKGPKIYHLSYADNLIVFSFGDKKSVEMLMDILEDYLDDLRQQINEEHNYFHTLNFRDKKTNRRMRKWTGFRQTEFSISYLGCIIYIGRKRSHLSGLATKVLNKVGV